MIPNDPKSRLRDTFWFQSGPLILSHLGPLYGPEKTGGGGSILSLATT
jgi:hypothetical protein